MKNTKRISGFIVAFSLFICLAMPTFAAESTLVTATSSGHSFSSDWSGVATGVNNSTLTYGFNTFAIDEDYAYAGYSQCYHYARISNGNGTYSCAAKYDGLAKLEVTHHGSSVTYKNIRIAG